MQFDNLTFKLLLKNPAINSYRALFANDTWLSSTLGYKFSIPYTLDKAFIFSCFALSIDGKLQYPDNRSGFFIASNNYHATDMERMADLFTLMLARTISDAIIIGTHSLNNELGSYFPKITDSRLNNLRNSYYTKAYPTVILVCNSLDNIDFANPVLKDDEHQVILCTMNDNLDLMKLPNYYQKIDTNQGVNKDNLAIKNFLSAENLTILTKKLYQMGFEIILNESPYSHHQLLELKLLDEIWLNYSGSYIGGAVTSLGNKQEAFNSNNHPDSEILTLQNLSYNFLYSRQKILYS